MKKINVKYDNNNNSILEFVKETKEGKYTQEKPQVVDITYHRIDIQEQSESIELDEYQENSYLFGITS
jgi:hypothetical protein